MNSTQTFIALNVLPILLFIAILCILFRFEVRRKGSVRAVFQNNIFKNPRGWAQQMVGSAWRYRLQQASAIVLAVAIGANIYAIARLAERGHVYIFLLAGAGFLIFVATVALPLSYLRALRRLVGDAQQGPSRSDSDLTSR
jgi:hypothetical protein